MNKIVDLQLNRNWDLRTYETPLGMLNESLQLSDLTNLTIQIELDPKHDAEMYNQHADLIIDITEFAEYHIEKTESEDPIMHQTTRKLENSYNVVTNYRNRKAFVLDNKQLNIANTGPDESSQDFSTMITMQINNEKLADRVFRNCQEDTNCKEQLVN